MQVKSYLLEDIKSIKGKYWSYKKPLKSEVDFFKNKYNIPIILANILVNKMQKEDVASYLRPSFKKNLPDPNILRNMDKTINIIIDNMSKKKKIGLLGDYDVDGATSSAIIFQYFKEINIETDVYIPDRAKDGYGISCNSVDYFIKKKIDLLIALDCGSNDVKSIDYAKDNNIEIIVIDHHEIKTPGDPLSIINPKHKKDNSGLDILCTAGLSFLFIIALNRKLRNNNFFKEVIEPDLKKLLDIVAIGTICDVVPLKKINRLLVKKGLEVININPNNGIDVLRKKLNLNTKITASDLAYYLGPCINAAGRIGNSKLGFNLLTKDNKELLEGIADKLIFNNKERKTLENMMYEQAKKLTKKNIKNNFIFLASKNWHPGIIGIIASKLVEKFNKPAFVISINNNIATGSVRSLKNIDISKILEKIYEEGYIETGGGHAMAGGFKIKNNMIDKLEDYFKNNNKMFSFKEDNQTLVDAVTAIDEINISLVEKIEKLEPFGIGNREPRFALKNIQAIYSRVIGRDNNHISCTLEDIYGNKIKAVAFNSTENNISKALLEKKKIHVLGKIKVNEWLEKKVLQFLIEDLIIL
jgi:single-stranded-DNA-specific exonuclease